MNTKSELVHIAAFLARGGFLPSDNWEYWKESLPKSTPKSAIREITQQSSDAAEKCKELAIRLRNIADSLES